MSCCLIPLLIAAIGAGPEGVAVKNLVQGNNQFATDLYGQVRNRPGNVFLSPYSISSALAMTYAGAGGETARQMAATLHFPSQGEDLHAAFASLDEGIDGGVESRPYQLTTANALWGQEGLSYQPNFLKLTEKYYRAGLRPVDFADDPPAARLLINSWVEEKTRNKIKDLLSPNDINQQTDLILTNAIYFKGAWASPFQKLATKEEDFFTEQGKMPVPTMHQTARFGYLDGEVFQALDLPYSGNSLSMVVLLPKKPDGLTEFEASFTSKKLEGWLAKLSRDMVEVALPRFKLECGIELGDTLSKMGMTLAFSSKADFSGMTTDRSLFIAKVIHKAFADVNEEGTEAAAATAVVMQRAMAIREVKPPVVFRADHPFLFLIRDLKSGSILFLGRVANPKG